MASATPPLSVISKTRIQRDSGIYCPLTTVHCPLILTVLVLLLSVSASAQAPAPPPQTPPASPNYIVGAQDVLNIIVWNQKEISGKYTVEADGSFTFPWIGRVQAAGLTLQQIDTELKKRLADGWLKNPQLSVSIDTYRSQRVYITGEVRTPGPYVLTGEMSLVEALARAGYTTPNAGPEVIVVRAPEGKKADGPLSPGDNDGLQTVRVDLKDLNSSAGQNLFLRDGDKIFVPAAEMVFVTGFVKNTGAYPLRFKEVTVMQVLSLAGGVTDRGSTGRITILRVVDGAKKEIKVKETDLVQPNDTIKVGPRFF